MTPPVQLVRLVREPRGAMHAFGTVTWQVHLGGTWIGWVGDERRWTGSRFAGRHWWACWRQDGDRYARANTDHLRTRRAAVAWLIYQATRPTEPAPDRKEIHTP